MSEVIQGSKEIHDRLVELLEDQLISSDQFAEVEMIITYEQNVELHIDRFDGSFFYTLKSGSIDLCAF